MRPTPALCLSSAVQTQPLQYACALHNRGRHPPICQQTASACAIRFPLHSPGPVAGKAPGVFRSHGQGGAADADRDRRVFVM